MESERDWERGRERERGRKRERERKGGREGGREKEREREREKEEEAIACPADCWLLFFSRFLHRMFFLLSNEMFTVQGVKHVGQVSWLQGTFLTK